MNDCVFSDGSPSEYGRNEDKCPEYIVHEGCVLYFGHFIEEIANSHTDVLFTNVSIERVASDDELSLVYFGGADVTWQGGGIRDCTFSQGVEAHTYNSVLNPIIQFSDLEFANLSLHGPNNLFEFVVSFYGGVQSTITDCTFRDITIPEIDFISQQVLQLEETGRLNDTSIPKIVEDCSFENISATGDLDNHQAGAICVGATLVADTVFRSITRPQECIVLAQKVEACLVADCDMPGTSYDSAHPDSQWLIDGQTRTLDNRGVGIRAFEVVDIVATGNYTERTLVEVADYSEGCTFSNNQFNPLQSGFRHALHVAMPGAMVRDALIQSNTIGPGAVSSSTHESVCGVLLHNGSILHSSTITQNSSLLEEDDSSMAVAVSMLSGSTVFNCNITQNGYPIGPDDSHGHVAIYASLGPDQSSIINSTICGNAGDHIGGIELRWTGQPESDLLIANSVVANNVILRDFPQIPDCPDLHPGSGGSCLPRSMQVANTLTTPDYPLFVNEAANDYRLAPGSPGIDAGDNTWVLPDIFDLDNDGDTIEPVPFDADGNPRFADDPGIPGNSVDIGAYEFQDTSCLADVNNDGFVTAADFTAWIDAFNNNQPPADQNRDGDINAADFTAWIANFNAGC